MTILETIQPWLEQYGAILVFLFAVLHPLTENPWSFLTLSLALSVLGIPMGYAVLLGGNLVGIVVLFVVAKWVQTKSHDYLHQKQLTRKALIWLESTATWRHIIVIGMPSVPTYPVKIALPFTNISFSMFLITLGGSYLFLHTANSLLYFGVLSFITDTIPPWIGTILLILFASYIYFGKTLRQKWLNKNNEVT